MHGWPEPLPPGRRGCLQLEGNPNRVRCDGMLGLQVGSQLADRHSATVAESARVDPVAAQVSSKGLTASTEP